MALRPFHDDLARELPHPIAPINARALIELLSANVVLINGDRPHNWQSRFLLLHIECSEYSADEVHLVPHVKVPKEVFRDLALKEDSQPFFGIVVAKKKLQNANEFLVFHAVGKDVPASEEDPLMSLFNEYFKRENHLIGLCPIFKDVNC